MISIYRNITKVADVEPMTSSNYIETLMSEHQMPLAFEVPAYVELLIGDYINYEGVKYTVNKLPTVKKISTKLYQYNAIFQHPKYDMLKVLYMLFDNTATPAQGEFSLTGTADTFVDMLIANMNRIYSGWTKGTVLESEYKTLTFTNENCYAVIERLAQEFETEFHVMNKTVYFDKIATQRELTLEYGSTAYDIERLSVNSQDVVTRLYAFGSDKNISSQYRDGSAKLLIPSPNSYLESANVAAYGVVEQAKVFDDIYPRLSLLGAGIVTSVGDKYTFSDSALDFDVNYQLMPGVPAKVRFLTGECAGYDFEIKSYNHATKTYVIIENSKDEDLVLPTDLIKPAVGDKYVLLDVVMPDAYVLAAEAELLAKAQEYLSANDTAKVEYRVTFSALYAKQNLPVIQCSDQVRVYDPDLGVDEYIRIVKLQKGIRDGHNIQIDLSNTVTRSTLQRIDGEIKSINNQVIVSNQINKQRGIEAYQRTRELQQMVYDPDGYFDPENIRPLSIETSMLSVGAKSQQYQLTCLLQPNYNANPQSMYWGSGLLTHFTLVDDQVKEWVMASGNITITGDNQTRALYIYARCSRVGSTGDIYLSENAIKFDSDASYWYFLVGILHTPVSGVRGISLSYGQTTINGQFVRTGVISSTDGSTYFNLNTGEIGGNIKFKSGSTYTDVGAGIAGAINTAAADATTKANAAEAAATSVANEAYGYADEAYNEALSAQQSAYNAQESANTANSLLSNIASDSKLTPDEKQATKKEWDAIVAEYTPILNQGTNFGITTNKTTFTIKYNALSDYILPLLSNLTTTSDITGTDFRTKFSEYYTAKVNLLNSISTAARDLAQQGVDDAYDAANAASAAQGAANTAQAGVNALNYLKTALAGSTEISGGLVSTNIILIKNAMEAITGGLSGIDDDNIGFWTGGTYSEALANVAKIILRKDGSGQLAGGGIKWDALASLVEFIGKITATSGKVGGFDIRNNAITTSKIAFSDSVVETLSSLYSPYSVSVLLGYDKAVSGIGTPSSPIHAFTNPITLDYDSVLYFGVSIGDTVGVEHSTVEIKDASDNIVFSDNLLGAWNKGYEVNLPSGTYTVHLKSYSQDFPNFTYLNISVEITDSYGTIYYLVAEGNKTRTKIGNNGFYSYWALANYLYYSAIHGLEYKGTMNIPGVLAAGSIASGGTRSNHWGAKTSNGGVTKGATGIYNIPHQVGHTSYTVFVTPKDGSMVSYCPNKYSDSVQIAIRNLSGVLSDCAFDYMIVGNN